MENEKKDTIESAIEEEVAKEETQTPEEKYDYAFIVKVLEDGSIDVANYDDITTNRKLTPGEIYQDIKRIADIVRDDEYMRKAMSVAATYLAPIVKSSNVLLNIIGASLTGEDPEEKQE